MQDTASTRGPVALSLMIATLLLGACRTTQGLPAAAAGTGHAEQGLGQRDSGAAAGASVRRLIAKKGSLSVVVPDVAEAVASATHWTTTAGGIVLRSETSKESPAQLQLLVPSDAFDEALDTLSGLGDLRSRNEEASDVTDEAADVEADLTNKRALRDRLRLLLERAKSVKEVLAVEHELTRLQTDIDTIEGRLDRLRRSAAMSSISATFIAREKERKPRILGPIGYLWVGTKWFVTKLFVIRE
jgi:hypothetical protein